MAVAPQNAAASTLADVIRQVQGAFEAAGDATPVQVGAQLRSQFGVGHGPKVLFVPEEPGQGGKLAGAQSLGYPASQVHACDVYVRAAEPSTDVLECLDTLYTFNDFVVGLVQTATTGRVEWGACSDDSPLKTPSGLGVGLGWSFTYRRDIGHDVKRHRGPLRNSAGDIIATPMSAPADTSAPTLPTSPAAILSDDVTITIAATAKD
jgi:hypothetical protein